MKNLVIFDFSGTLSRGAVLFGKEENLIRELKQSGLWQIGLNSVDIFWNDVIAPTWQQGATTTIGYKNMLTARLNLICHGSKEDISRCVAVFADRYFNSSRIHPAWTPLKGGHLKSKQSCDILYSKMDDTLCHFEAERIDTINTHGTGCTLSSAIASNLAKGPSIREAILRAKEYITQALKVGAAYRLGSGHGSVHHFHNFWE